MTTATARRRGSTPRRRGIRAGPRPDAQAGMVTAETAAALPALAVVLVLAVYAVAAATAQLRVSDAAREGARALARGDDPATVLAVAGRVAPAGSQVRLSGGGGLVEVTVTAGLPLPAVLAEVLPAPTVRGEAVAVREPG